jgi:hypothetical protein
MILQIHAHRRPEEPERGRRSFLSGDSTEIVKDSSFLKRMYMKLQAETLEAEVAVRDLVTFYAR